MKQKFFKDKMVMFYEA